MSFRGRLTLFFVAIVVVPMVAVAVLVVQVTDDSRNGKADARLASALGTAQELYDRALLGGARGRRPDRGAARDRSRARGSQRGVPRNGRPNSRQAQRGIAAVAFYDAGRQAARRGRRQGRR